MNEIPRKFPTVVTDRAVYCLESMVDLIIQLEMEFDHELDTDRLNRALRLALDAEPILGCRFVYDDWRPYWLRLENIDDDQLVIANDADAYEKFKLESLDAFEGPQIRACLWRGPGGDKLLLKVAHLASDAGGVKEISSIISGIYNRLKDDPEYRPVPNLQGSRSIWQVMCEIPWHKYPKIFFNHLRSTYSKLVPLATHQISIAIGPGQTKLVVHDLPAGQVDRLAAWGRERQATLNDLLMAAFFRAQAKVGDWDGKSQLRLYYTADLRRYIPGGRGRAVCNMSAIEFMRLGTDLGEDFDHTLKRVTNLTRRQKSNWIGLGDYVGSVPPGYFLPIHHIKRGFDNFVRFSIEKKNIANSITNMGPIAMESVTFDKAPRMARLLPPIAKPPHLLAAVSGYNGVLTLSAACAYPNGQAEIIERLLDATISELSAAGSRV
jgi:NRPS condensation-like uncharacterized protein